MAKKITELTGLQKQDLNILMEVLNDWFNEGKQDTAACTRVKTQVEEVLKKFNVQKLNNLYDEWIEDNNPARQFFITTLEILIETKGEHEVKKQELEECRYPHTILNGQGQESIINHSENTAECFRRREVKIKYNELIKDVEVMIQGKSFHDQTKNTAILTILKDFCSEESVPYQHIEEHIMKMAGENAYHPVKVWMDTLEWDGVSRIDDMLNTLTLGDDTDPKLARTLLERWLMMSVAAVIRPNGISPQGALTLVGKQGLGKTKWIKSWVPVKEWVTTDLQIDPHNKDDVIRFVKNWIVELGELDATFRKADLAALKSFITRDKDSFRAPYGKKNEEYKRQTVFYATVNDYEFLQDDENRRFWPLSVTAVNAEHNIDINQLWAEAKHLYETQKVYWLSAEELESLHSHNKKFTSVHPIIERVQASGIVNPVGIENTFDVTYRKNCTSILTTVGVTSPTKADVNKLANYLRLNGFTQPDKGTKEWLIAFEKDKIVDLKNVVRLNKKIKVSDPLDLESVEV